MKSFLAPIVLSLLVFVSISCSSHSEGDGHDHGNALSHDHEEGEGLHDEHEENTTMVSLTAEQMKSIDLTLGSLEHKNLSSGFKANGFLKVPNQNKATVNTLFSGSITGLNVMPGSVVSKGQTIATIINPQFIPLQEEYLELSPRITLAESERDRQAILSSGNAGALKNLQAAEAEVKSLHIRKASLEKQLTLMGINAKELSYDNLISQVAVRSPIGGSVASVLVNLGTNVDAETPIAEVVDNSQLHLDLFVYEKDLPQVEKGQSVEFILTNQHGKYYSAEVFSIGSNFENVSKSIAVHCIVKGDKRGLIEGMSVTAQVNIGNANVAALPNEAFVNQDGVDFVFVESKGSGGSNAHNEVGDHAEEKEHEGSQPDVQSKHFSDDSMQFQKIPVRKGVSDMGYTEVTLIGDVPANGQFVIKGAFFLLSKMMNTGEAHEH